MSSSFHGVRDRRVRATKVRLYLEKLILKKVSRRQQKNVGPDQDLDPNCLILRRSVLAQRL